MKIREAGHNMAAAVFHHGSQSTPALTPEQMAQAAEQEKEFIAHFSDVQRPLAPGEIQQAPRNKELGRSSKGLSVRDFELVRTLGTGTYLCFLRDSAPCRQWQIWAKTCMLILGL